MLGLRVSEACATQIGDLRYSARYELLRAVGKGSKPVEIPVPIPVLRAVKGATDGRAVGPVLLSRAGGRMSRGAAAWLLARASGVTSLASPHALRRTFCTAGLISGVPLRDMQYAMRDADARTTMRYDMARANLDPSPHRTRSPDAQARLPQGRRAAAPRRPGTRTRVFSRRPSRRGRRRRYVPHPSRSRQVGVAVAGEMRVHAAT